MAKKTTAGAGKIPQKKKSFKDVCKENIGFFFILPWLFGFLAFKLKLLPVRPASPLRKALFRQNKNEKVTGIESCIQQDEKSRV